GADWGVAFGLVQSTVELGGHLRVDGVDGLGRVERNGDDRTFLLVQDRLVSHLVTSWASRQLDQPVDRHNASPLVEHEEWIDVQGAERVPIGFGERSEPDDRSRERARIYRRAAARAPPNRRAPP